MIMSFKRFKRQLPRRRLSTVLRALTCMALAPIVFAFIYAAAMLLIGALWWVCGLVGDQRQLLPYTICGLFFLVLWSFWEMSLNRKLYTRYLAKQSKVELEQLVATPPGVFSRSDRRAAANVLVDAHPQA